MNLKKTEGKIKLLKSKYGTIKNKILAEELSISITTLKRWASKEGLSGGTQNYNFNVDYFKNKVDWDYWVGFLLADGNMYIENNGIVRISFVTKDYEIAKNFNIFTENKVKINVVKEKYYSCRLSSKTLGDLLSTYGMKPRKNKTGNFCFLKPLTWNILRGYFDADGTVTKIKNTVGFTSKSYKSLKQIQDFLGYGKITPKSNGIVKDYYELRFHNISDFKNFYKNIYNQTSKVGLTRKKERFENRLKILGILRK